MTTSIMKKLRDQGCGTSMRQEDEAAARWPYASIQLSCSLRMRSRGPSSEPKRNDRARGPRKRDFEHIRSDLEHLVARCGDKFCIRTLYDSTMKQAETSHTLLPGLSRHRVIDALPRDTLTKEASKGFRERSTGMGDPRKTPLGGHSFVFRFLGREMQVTRMR